MSYGARQLGPVTILEKFICAVGIHSNENHKLKEQLGLTKLQDS